MGIGRQEENSEERQASGRGLLAYFGGGYFEKRATARQKAPFERHLYAKLRERGDIGTIALILSGVIGADSVPSCAGF